MSTYQKPVITVTEGLAESYNQDNGNRMPSWERKGYQPDDTVTDWNM